MSNSSDIIIIGSGVIGSSIAYHLARAGQQVTVLERAEPGAEPSASWASAGGVRRQGRHAAEAKLASEAIERWRTLEAELEADVHYRREGNLLLAENDADAEKIREFVRVQNANGFADVRFVDRAEALEIAPELNDAVLAGSYAPEDGHASPPLTTRAFAAAAQRLGAAYRNGVDVTGLVARGGRIAGVQTTNGTIEADHVVLAAGAWSDDIALTVGLRLPIRTGVYQMLLSTPATPGLLRPVLSSLGRALSLKQIPSGAFFLGGGWPGDTNPERRSFTVRPQSEAGSWETAVGLLPVVGTQRVADRWCGLEAESIDEVPFLGPVPGYDGLTIAVGFTGHGFAIAPAVGRAVTDELLGADVPELEGLRAARIAALGPDEVQQFVTSENPERAAAG